MSALTPTPPQQQQQQQQQMGGEKRPPQITAHNDSKCQPSINNQIFPSWLTSQGGRMASGRKHFDWFNRIEMKYFQKKGMPLIDIFIVATRYPQIIGSPLQTHQLFNKFVQTDFNIVELGAAAALVAQPDGPGCRNLCKWVNCSNPTGWSDFRALGASYANEPPPAGWLA